MASPSLSLYTEKQQEQLEKSLDRLFDMNTPVDSWFNSETYIQIYTHVYDICTFINPERTSSIDQIDFGRVAWNILYMVSKKHLEKWSTQLSLCPNPIDLYATLWNRYQNIIPHIEAIFLYLERHWIMRMINNDNYSKSNIEHEQGTREEMKIINQHQNNQKEIESETKEKIDKNSIKTSNSSIKDQIEIEKKIENINNVTFTRVLLFRLWHVLLLFPNETLLKSLMTRYLMEERMNSISNSISVGNTFNNGNINTNTNVNSNITNININVNHNTNHNHSTNINHNMIIIFQSYSILSTPISSMLRKHPIDSGIRIYHKSLEPWYIDLLGNYCEGLSRQMSLIQMNNIQGVRNLFTKWKEEINRANLYLEEGSKKLVKNTLKSKLLNPVIDGILILYEKCLGEEKDPRESLLDIYGLFAQKRSLSKFLEEPTERAFIKRFDGYGIVPKAPNDTFVGFIEFLQKFKIFWDDSNDILRDSLKMDEELIRRRDRALSVILGEIGINLAEYVARALDTLINQYSSSDDQEQDHDQEQQQIDMQTEIEMKRENEIKGKSKKEFGNAQREFANFIIGIVFKYVVEKDRFQNWNIRLMARRLTRNGGNDLGKNAEEMIIGYIKKACGSQYSQPLEKMINDVEMSRETTIEFHNQHQHHLGEVMGSITSKSKKIRGGIVASSGLLSSTLPTLASPLSASSNFTGSTPISNYQILTFGIWPFKPVDYHHQHQNSLFVNQLSNYFIENLKKFEEFYSKIHTGRIIRWLPNLSTIDLIFHGKSNNDSDDKNDMEEREGEVNRRGKGGKCEITVNFYQYKILEYLENNLKMVTLDELVDAFSSIADISSHIEPLFSSGLLINSLNGKIVISDTFNVLKMDLTTNDMLSCSNPSILNMERNETSRSLALDRQTTIQAAIVRYMKAHKQCSRATLVNAIVIEEREFNNVNAVNSAANINLDLNSPTFLANTNNNVMGKSKMNDNTNDSIIATMSNSNLNGKMAIENSDQIIQAIENLANREFIKIDQDLITYIA